MWIAYYFYHGHELGQSDQVERNIHKTPPELIHSRGTTISKSHTQKPVEPKIDNKMDIIIFSTGVFGTRISL